LWLAAALLDLLFLLAVRVRWLRRRRVVLCDRYLLDTLVDFRLNFPGDDVEHWWLWRALERLALRPDVAFVLLVPVAESRRRSDIKGEPFRDSPAVLAERLVHYRALAAPDRFTVLDGSRSVTEIADTIGAALGLPPARNDAHQPAA
jgi:thymidylate kinase